MNRERGDPRSGDRNEGVRHVADASTVEQFCPTGGNT